MIAYDDWDDAIIGYAYIWRGNERVMVVVYNGDLMIDAMVRDGLEYADAREHVAFNIEGGYVGLETPVVVWAATRDELDDMADAHAE